LRTVAGFNSPRRAAVWSGAGLDDPRQGNYFLRGAVPAPLSLAAKTCATSAVDVLRRRRLRPIADRIVFACQAEWCQARRRRAGNSLAGGSSRPAPDPHRGARRELNPARRSQPKRPHPRLPGSKAPISSSRHGRQARTSTLCRRHAVRSATPHSAARCRYRHCRKGCDRRSLSASCAHFQDGRLDAATPPPLLHRPLVMGLGKTQRKRDARRRCRRPMPSFSCAAMAR